MIYTFIPDKTSGRPIYIQLYEYIRDEIKLQHIKSGEKLPSIRETASTLRISKTTIENAYFQLLTEGYIESQPKKGYFAIDVKDYFSDQLMSISTKSIHSDSSSHVEARYINEDTHLGSIDLRIWKKLYNRILSESEDAVYSSGSYQGEYQLRNEISGFVNATRGGHTNPEQIVIGAGIQYLIGILSGIIKHDIRTAAVESPGYEKARYIFEDYGFKTIDIPVKGDGINMTALEASGASLVYVSPSHQFPTGSLMPIAKRLELLSWAEKKSGYILEDDYDSLIRFESRPVPCLQGLDKSDRVIYLGSFSKILTPALRISYMILPERLINPYLIISTRYTQSSSKLEQLTLSSFIKEGHIDKHLRKIKRIYSKKRDLLIPFLQKIWPGPITLISADSGLHSVVAIESEWTPEEITRLFDRHRILINIIRRSGTHYELSIAYSGLPFALMNS
ncbi:MAG: PLP-dependent aminotransferase family protein [Tissierellales bacterium]|nr:PLP-dependent aminotransferase family protein [Tissierellales bacterium]